MSSTQTLRVRITGTVGDLLRATAEARAAIRGIGSESDRNTKPVRSLTDGLAKFGSVMRGLRAIALPAAITLATPSVLGLAAALAQAAGAGLILPGALAGAITVVGALKIGFSGITDTIKAYGAAQTNAASDTAALAARQTAAADAVVSAQKRVKSAESDAVDAVNDERRARDALNDAYKAAIRSLEDLREKVSDLTSDQEGAAISLARAQENLDKVNTDATSTALDRREAEYEVTQALNRQRDIVQESERAHADLADAERKGVDGSDQVVTAQQRITDAQKRVSDTSDAVTEAQQALATATAAAATAATAATSGMDKFNSSLAKLSPSAQDAVRAIIGLRGIWEELRLSVQERLFAGLATEITATGQVLINVLRPAFEAIASTANHALSGILIDLRSVRSQADLRSITTDSATAFSNLARAVRPLLRVLTDVAAVGASFLPGLTAGAGSAAQRFADMVSRMRQTGELAAIIQRGLDVLKQLGEIASNVGGILAGVFRAADAAGGGLLNTLVSTTGTLKEIINSTSGQTALGAFFATLATISATLGGALRILAPALAVVLTNLQTAITLVAPSIGPLAASIGAILVSLAPLLPLIGQVAAIVAGQLTAGLTILKPLIDAVVAVLQFLSPVLIPVVASLVTMKIATLALTTVMGAGSSVIGSVTTAWKILSLVFAASPIGFIITLLALLVGGLIYAYNTSETFRNVVDGVFRWISNAISSAISFISGLFSGLVDWFRNLGPWALSGLTSGFWSVISFFTGIPSAILRAIGLGNLGRMLWDAGASIVSGLWDGLVARWNQMLDWVRSGLSALRDLFPFSPAKKGPFSGRGYTTFAGTALIMDMTRSVRAALPALNAAGSAAMSGLRQRLTGTAPLAVAGVRGPGGSTGLDPAELAAVIGAELRSVFAGGIRTDVDYQGLTLRLNAVNRSNARR